jgi:hypothetical protein
MGLDVTPDCWSGPYSMFMRWRQALARKVGIPLDLMEGYYPPGISDGARYWSVTTVDVLSHPNFDWPDSDYRSEGLDEFMAARPEFAAWREKAKADGHVERRYTQTYIDRNGGRHEYEVAEVPAGPPIIVPKGLVSSLEWARARGPNGPESHSHMSPSLERFIADIGSWLPISWDLFPFHREPLRVLLDHSDCDGRIDRRHMLRLAGRLEEIADLFSPTEGSHPRPTDGNPLPARGCYDGYRNACLRFAAGLREAHAGHQPVLFG